MHACMCTQVIRLAESCPRPGLTEVPDACRFANVKDPASLQEQIVSQRHAADSARKVTVH